ncbi:hypothetical protein [Sphingobium sp. OAS761]|uniref:hypothetical protein n=1 Tax=Sphingobium sp. OAS761 TaxID=2817901 RepID=UPI00209D1F71|nr:hypothetical protein [Sphingobium sp. OAS761]
MLLSYEDFRSYFEARGIAEAVGRAQLETFEQIIDSFVIEGLEGKASGKDVDPDSDPALIPLEWNQILELIFNDAAADTGVGKKET